MDQSQIIDALYAVLGGLGVLLFYLMRLEHKQLRDNHDKLVNVDKELAEKVAAIELLVTGQYVRRDDFDAVTNRIYSSLQRIEDKLDGKADKH